MTNEIIEYHQRRIREVFDELARRELNEALVKIDRLELIIERLRDLFPNDVDHIEEVTK